MSSSNSGEHGLERDDAAASLAVDADGTVLSASPRALGMFGYAEGEIRGMIAMLRRK